MCQRGAWYGENIDFEVCYYKESVIGVQSVVGRGGGEREDKVVQGEEGKRRECEELGEISRGSKEQRQLVENDIFFY